MAFSGEWMRLPVAGPLPPARCGHTLSLVGSGDSRNLLVTFGESSLLDNRTFYNDMHLFHLGTNTWRKMSHRNPFTARADHSATVFGNDNEHVFFFGGKRDGTYLSDAFFLTKLPDQPDIKAIYTRYGPCGRRGHTVTTRVQKTKLVLFGGQNGNLFLNDLWEFDPMKMMWTERKCKNDPPKIPARAYHSTFFDMDCLIVIGGVKDSQATAVDPTMYRYDMREGCWHNYGSKDMLQGALSTGHHSSHLLSTHDLAIFQNQRSECYVFGGRRGSSNLGKCSRVETCAGPHHFPDPLFRSSSVMIEDRSDLYSLYTYGGFCRKQQNSSPHVHCLKFCEKRYESYFNIGTIHRSSQFSGSDNMIPKQTKHLKHQLDLMEEKTEVVATPKKQKKVKHSQTPLKASQSSSVRSVSRVSQVNKKRLGDKEIHPEMVEVKEQSDLESFIIHTVLRGGCEGKYGGDKAKERFFLTSDLITDLSEQASVIFNDEKTLIEVTGPIKVFGDIHGQYEDLMKIFRTYGAPDDVLGDIKTYNYLFLGDFVDRGQQSLEVICLLFALKIKHPQKIFLIRGNHEDITMNEMYGFSNECKERIHPQPEKAFLAITRAFTYLPLGALIEKKILCVHGGIGRLTSIQEIAQIRRPIIVNTKDPNASQDKTIQAVLDILWSDPAETDDEMGLQPNKRGTSVMFGADLVKKFCANNAIDLIIRAHQVVEDGYEYFAEGKLITIFSATDYCGFMKNSGAILQIDQDLVVQPQIVSAKVSHSSWRMDAKTPPSPMRRKHKRLTFSP